MTDQRSDFGSNEKSGAEDCVSQKLDDIGWGLFFVWMGVAFVMPRLSFTDVAAYTATLPEWATDSANPMVVDAH